MTGDDGNPDGPPIPGSMPEAFMVAMDVVHQVRETCKGYRTSLLQDGYSPPAAEAMTVQLHAHLLGGAFSGKAPAQS